jgi:cobalt-zinc-cadmium efflux system protein
LTDLIFLILRGSHYLLYFFLILKESFFTLQLFNIITVNDMAHNHNHEHKHKHGTVHNHSHGHNANKKALILSFCLTLGFMLIEFVGGLLTNSLALLSDAGHMLSDAVALGLSLAAFMFGQKAATPEKTYGYKRSEILAALLNGIALVVLSAYILYEAIMRLSSPPHVIGKGMMLISILGLIINVAVAWILSRGESKHNLNMRSAFLHVLGDLLGSAGAIIAAILILAFGWNIADPIAGMVVSVLILYSGWHVLKDSVEVLMESKPSDVDIDEVITLLKGIPGVEGIHDLHIWMITQEFPALTAHLLINKEYDRDEVLEKAIEVLAEHTGIHHITIQIEGRTLKLHKNACQLCEVDE